MVVTIVELMLALAFIIFVLSLTLFTVLAALLAARHHPATSWLREQDPPAQGGLDDEAGGGRWLRGRAPPPPGGRRRQELACCQVTGRRCGASTRDPYRTPANETIVIRALTGGDAPRLIELAQQVESSRDRRDRREVGTQLNLGAVCNGRLVAVVLASHHGPAVRARPRATLEQVLLDRSCRRQGAAGLLVVRLMAELRARCGGRPWVAVSREAWQLMLRCGWSAEARVRD